MTKCDKDLLIKDLCGRLPYGVLVEENRYKMDTEPVVYCYDYHPCISDCKPYLRPLSSMNKDERKELSQQFEGEGKIDIENIPYVLCRYFEYDYNSFELGWKTIQNVMDWLNSHHFDYRGLIPMGLALEAPEGMYN